MKRWMLTLAAIATVACGGPQQSEEPKEVPQTEEGAYEESVYAEARSEWEPLAQQGDPISQKNLGVMYYLGQGVPRDYGQAFDWFTKAASQGENVAQQFLGVMYAEGQGADRDETKALMWLILSAEQGNSSSIRRHDELMAKMPAEQVSEAKKLAMDWMPGQ